MGVQYLYRPYRGDLLSRREKVIVLAAVIAAALTIMALGSDALAGRGAEATGAMSALAILIAGSAYRAATIGPPKGSVAIDGMYLRLADADAEHTIFGGAARAVVREVRVPSEGFHIGNALARETRHTDDLETWGTEGTIVIQHDGGETYVMAASRLSPHQRQTLCDRINEALRVARLEHGFDEPSWPAEAPESPNPFGGFS